MNYLVNSIPAIPRGFYKFEIQLTDTSYISIVPPKVNELPMCDISFFLLAKSIKADNLLQVIHHIILEHSVLFVSKRIEILGPIIQLILSFLFPFEYQMICIPLLPQKSIDIIQTTCPYIIGVAKSTYETIQNDITPNVLIVDLDEDKVILHERKWYEANFMNVRVQDVLAPLPAHEQKKLQERVSKSLNKLKVANELDESKKKIEERETLIKNLRNSFLLFFVSCLKNSNDFIILKDGSYKVLHRKISKTNDDYKWFLIQFTNTAIFKNWLKRKSNPKNYADAYDLLFFEESIIAKRNRTSFIMSAKIVN